MATDKIQSSDSGQAIINKTNAGLGAVDLAHERIDVVVDRAATNKSEAADQISGISTRQSAVEAALAAQQILIAPYQDLVGGTPNRPGDSRTLFTRELIGSPKARKAIDRGTVEDGGELGQVLRITGADTDPVLGYLNVAPRRAYYMRASRAYVVRYAFARSMDPSDPSQHAIELRFQNLNGRFSIISDVRFGDPYIPFVANGSYFVDVFIGKSGAPGNNSYVIPGSSRYGVPYFRVYGNGHQTDLAEVWLYDVTDMVAGGADIASILSRIAKLESVQSFTQSTGYVLRNTWASGGTADTALSLVTPPLNTIGEVPDADTGFHAGISTEAGYDPQTGMVPNAGRYNPTGNPLAWRRVSNTTSKLAADVLVDSIPLFTYANSGGLQMTFRDPVTKKVVALSVEDSRKYLMDPVTYSSEPPGLTAELSSKVILPADDQRKAFQIQCETHDLAVNWAGRDADFSRDSVVYAGTITDFTNKGKDAVSVTARPSALRTIIGASIPAKVWVSQDRLVPGFFSGSLFGDTILSRYPDQSFSKAYRAVLRDEINKLNDAGKWPTKGWVQFPIHSLANALTNVIDPKTPFLVKVGPTGKGLALVPYRNLAAAESGAALDTVKLPIDMGLAIDSGFFLLQPDINPEVGGGTLAGNSSQYYLKPNAGTTGAPAAGFRNGSGAQDSPTAPRGSMLMMNRIAADDYTAFIEAGVVTKAAARPGSTPGARSILLGANQNANGVFDPSLVPWRVAMHTPGLALQADCLLWRTAMKNILAAGETAAAAGA